jgi:short-chain fatty acids transporter
MQMCLILVTGHALASTKPMRKAIESLAGTPKSAGSAAVLVCVAACVTGLINWGLGLIVGALMAREVGRSMQRRGLPAHYPLLAAAGYMGLLVFHGGLSGSAPLSATTVAGARKVLPEAAVALIGEGIPLDRTLFSPLNLFVTGGMMVILPALFWLLTPRHPRDMQPIPQGQSIQPVDPMIVSDDGAARGVSIPDRLDRSAIVVGLLALLLLAGFTRYVYASGFLNIQINEVNALMFAAGLLLHGSPKAYMNAVEDGARDCGAIIVQFPIYAGIMALMKVSGMIEMLTDAFMRLGDARTLPAMSFISATLVGLFVPSGGAQWGLQGPVALQASANAGIDPGAMLMSVAYGDELANMLQPFWALPLLAITGAKAREIVGYTAIAMLVAGAWMALGLLLF